MDTTDDDCVLTKYKESTANVDDNGKIEVAIIDKVECPKYDDSPEPTTRLYRRRFLVLGIFCLYSMSSAFQWIEYAIITNIVLRYYVGATELAVAWTSMIYMLSYIPLMFVATWMLDNWGLRHILLFGGALNAIGSLIKIGSVSPDLFAVSFLGQSIAACAQSFILEIPPKIASLWFGPSEVSTATAVGVFGNQLQHGQAVAKKLNKRKLMFYASVYFVPCNVIWKTMSEFYQSTKCNPQLGVALGFVIPPLIVPDTNDKDAIAAGFRILFISSAVVCTIVLLLMFIVIRDKPSIPPSTAQALSIVEESKNQASLSPMKNYKRSIGKLIKSAPFLLLFLSYGINTGAYYAIGTLLNPIILNYHEKAVKQVGEIGLTMVVAGLGGSVICGYFLDKTKLYKSTTVGIYVLSMAFMVVFTFTLQLELLWLDYLTIGLLGFFMTGYLPIGFEFGAEITYPISEATSSGLLNVSAQIFGILFTLSAQELLNHYNSLVANIFMSVALLAGTILTVLIRSDLKRKAANEVEGVVVTEEKMTLADGDLKSNYNTNNNSNKKIEDESESSGFGEEEKLVRLTSTSSCYSAGPDW